MEWSTHRSIENISALLQAAAGRRSSASLFQLSQRKKGQFTPAAAQPINMTLIPVKKEKILTEDHTRLTHSKLVFQRENKKGNTGANKRNRMLLTVVWDLTWIWGKKCFFLSYQPLLQIKQLLQSSYLSHGALLRLTQQKNRNCALK